MPVSAAQLLAGANYTLQTYAQNDPIDQINTAHPFLEWLVSNRKDSTFGNGYFNEKVRISNSDNAVWFSGDDQVSYNRKDSVRLASYQHYEMHDGFALNETELANNGINLTDDKNAVTTDAEKIQIVNILKENYMTLKMGMQLSLDQSVHLDGTQGTKEAPGLDLLVSTTPSTGVIGGLDSSTQTYWQNNANLAIASTAGLLTKQMELSWRACTQYGGKIPDAIFCGSTAYDAIRNDAAATINRQIVINDKGGTGLDASNSGVYFKGKPVVWDPQFDALDVRLGVITYPWAKRIYFLNSKTICLRPNKGRWMIQRTPERVYDRYTHYFGTTTDYGLTIAQRNANAVLSVA